MEAWSKICLLSRFELAYTSASALKSWHVDAKSTDTSTPLSTPPESITVACLEMGSGG